MKSTPIPATLFTRNRKKLFDLMDPGSVAIVGSNEQKLRSGDQFFTFRQHSDFYYLTGINQPDSVLLCAPDYADPKLREILFIRKSTPKSDLWSGPGLTPHEATLLSGIGEVKYLDELDEYRDILFPGASSLYEAGKVNDEKILGQYPDLSLSQFSPLMKHLRMVKEFEEVEEIRKAGAITRSAFLRILGMVKPEVWEYEVEAEIIAEFLRKGAEGHAYEPIFASGKNALILHYVENNSRCRTGDLLLMDFGAEVNNYAADCSRTIPVNGRFSDRQRAVYDAVLRIFRKAREMMVPGAVMSAFHNSVGELWVEEHVALGLYTMNEVREQPPEEPLWKRYFMHGTSHSLGLDVHDTFDRTRPFEPGMVLTCEPAIYIPEEGIGIRLENDILITNEGPVDLLEDIPIEAAEIEEIMQSNR